MPPPPPRGGFGAIRATALARLAASRFTSPRPVLLPGAQFRQLPARIPTRQPIIRKIIRAPIARVTPSRPITPRIPVVTRAPTPAPAAVFRPRMLITRMPPQPRIITPKFELKPRMLITRVPTRPKEIMRLPSDGRPGDERAFIHKKLLRIASKVTSFIPGPAGAIVSGITGRLAGGGGHRAPARTLAPRTQTARVTVTSQQQKAAGAAFKLGDGVGGNGCAPGFREDFQTGQCEPGGGQGTGEAVLGNYGAGEVPGSMMVDRAVCRRGMVLANDGVCYNKSQIRNNQREWPAGRKPLLSGGDMRAISVAARAGRRLEGATKRLQRLGMMKKATRRAPARHQHAKPVSAVSV